jgi:hypothetical protein
MPQVLHTAYTILLITINVYLIKWNIELNENVVCTSTRIVLYLISKCDYTDDEMEWR